MINTNNTIPSSNSISGLASQNTTTTNGSANDMLASFEQILSLMTMSSRMSSISSGSGSNSGFDIGSMLAPIMLALMEKMLAGQLGNANSTSSTTSTSTSTASTTPATVIPQAAASVSTSTSATAHTAGNTAVPHGRPVGGVLTQGYHPGHYGLDFGIPVGTQVKTTMDGKVVYAGWNNQGYGNLVIVENGPYRTYYGHLSSVPVRVGQEVASGSVIGLSGNTGHSTGPHLHYEIRNNMAPIDPTSATL